MATKEIKTAVATNPTPDSAVDNTGTPKAENTKDVLSAVTTDLSKPGEPLPAHPNDVKFEVTDPKDTSMPKGVTVVSKETADHFESLGIGKIAKD